MADDKTKQPLLTAGKIAKEIGYSDGKVKKAINELGIEPDEKKGNCAYYGAASIAKLEAHLN